MIAQCRQCHKDFDQSNGNNFYCDACKLLRATKQKRESKAKLKHTKKQNGYKGGKPLKDWSPEAKERHWQRMKKSIANPTTPSSYWRKKELLASITEDFVRY